MSQAKRVAISFSTKKSDQELLIYLESKKDDVGISDDTSGILSQHGNDFELDLCQMDGNVVDGDQMLFKVDFQTLGEIRTLVQRGSRVQFIAVTDDRAYAGQEFCIPKGLTDVIISAQIQGENLFLFLCSGGYNNNGKTAPGTNLAQNVQTIHIRETQIQNHNIRTVGGDNG